MDVEICSNVPNAFWAKKKHIVDFSYVDNFDEVQILTRARPIQMGKNLVKIYIVEIEDLVNKGLISPSKSPWSCSNIYTYSSTLLRPTDLWYLYPRSSYSRQKSDFSNMILIKGSSNRSYGHYTFWVSFMILLRIRINCNDFCFPSIILETLLGIFTPFICSYMIDFKESKTMDRRAYPSSPIIQSFGKRHPMPIASGWKRWTTVKTDASEL